LNSIESIQIRGCYLGDAPARFSSRFFNHFLTPQRLGVAGESDSTICMLGDPGEKWGLKEAGLLGVGGGGFTLIAGFFLEIGFRGWPTPSGGVGVGILSTRISGGAFGTVESGIGPLA
jgi:hypothetical protein